MDTNYVSRQRLGRRLHLKILQKKIEHQRKELVNANRHVDIERDNRFMTLALNLLERVREEHYSLECMDYWHEKMEFNDVPDKPNLKSIDFVPISERFDEYLNKYPSSVRAIIFVRRSDGFFCKYGRPYFLPNT